MQMHVNKRMQENIGEHTRIQGNTREYREYRGIQENARRAQENN